MIYATVYVNKSSRRAFAGTVFDAPAQAEFFEPAFSGAFDTYRGEFAAMSAALAWLADWSKPRDVDYPGYPNRSLDPT